MPRAVTMLFIAAWFGFLAVSSASGIVSILAIAEFVEVPSGWMASNIASLTLTIFEGGNIAVLAAMFEAMFFLMIASTLLVGAWLLRSGTVEDRRNGARVAIAAFLAAGVVYGAVAMISVPLASHAATPAGIGFVIAASIAAVLLDRFSEIETETDDESEFFAATALIGRRMAADAVGRRERSPERDL